MVEQDPAPAQSAPLAAANAVLDDPYALGDLQQIAVELAKGRWVVYAHEWLPTGTDLAAWKAEVCAACEAAGVRVEVATDGDADVSIVMNTSAMPALAQIEASVAAVEQHRAQTPLHDQASASASAEARSKDR